MSDNSWYEKGEFPPVGLACEFMVGNFWKKCEIKGLAHDYGAPIVLAQIGDAAKSVVRAELFRPIKTEREIAIEQMSKDINLLVTNHEMIKNTVGLEDSILAKLYDAGYRKNES